MIHAHAGVRSRGTTLCSAAALLAALLVGVPQAARAVPGALVATVPLAVPGFGVSIAVGCDAAPILYYTVYPGLANDGIILHRMSPAGVNLGSLPILSAAGAPVQLDEMAYDAKNDIIWGCEHGSNPIRVWKINRFTGAATLGFVSATTSVGTFRDGITVDSNDDTIFLSGDVSTTVEHYTELGALINVLTPKDAAGANLGSISGLQVGVGDLLYLGRNGAGQIVQVKKSDGTFISSFASPGGRDEGLECDPRSFAPLVVMWSRDFNAPGRVDAIEVDPQTCRCGGVTPTRKATWGELKTMYR